jgi:hypothetical protein
MRDSKGRTYISRQRRGKHPNELLKDNVFPGSVLRLYNAEFQVSSERRLTRVEAGSNTSTVTLRVIGGDEKGSLKTETVKYGREIQGTRTRDLWGSWGVIPQCLYVELIKYQDTCNNSRVSAVGILIDWCSAACMRNRDSNPGRHTDILLFFTAPIPVLEAWWSLVFNGYRGLFPRG